MMASIEILLVEDDPVDLELEIRALKKSNLANNIIVFEDGSAVLDYIFGTGPYVNKAVNMLPHLIIMDLKLPKVSGLEVLKAIKSDSRTKQIPVVMLTSSREERDIVESYNLGVNSYVVKPLDFIQFSEAVSQLGLYWLLINQPPSGNEKPFTM